LFDRSQLQHPPRDNDRQHITRARAAAEAIFKPKWQVTGQPAAESPPPADASARQPRVLRISAAAPVRREELIAPVRPEPQASEIPEPQFAPIRAWVKYGMSAQQVAEVYGVAVDKIDRILRKV
jgi:hypothetical protein